MSKYVDILVHKETKEVLKALAAKKGVSIAELMAHFVEILKGELNKAKKND
jgi:DNA-binding transcriptional ArsR family regulator